MANPKKKAWDNRNHSNVYNVFSPNETLSLTNKNPSHHHHHHHHCYSFRHHQATSNSLQFNPRSCLMAQSPQSHTITITFTAASRWTSATRRPPCATFSGLFHQFSLLFLLIYRWVVLKMEINLNFIFFCFSSWIINPIWQLGLWFSE